MKTTKKALLLALCAVLLVVSTVFATLAYLTSETQVVRNTFTVGEIEITLDEAKVDLYGKVVAGADRVFENEYKLIPGHKYVKDPTIHVAKGSEECYLFVKVVNGISAIEADTTIADQMAAKGWVALTGVENVYYLNKKIDASAAAVDVPVFAEFIVKGNAVVSNYVTAKDESGDVADDAIVIDVTAYAVQADGFGTAQAAWTATFGA
jgi:hypothetical protein